MDDYSIEIYKNVLSGSMKRFPAHFWSDDALNKHKYSAQITRYFIEEVLKWDDEKIKKDICCKVFFRYRLKGMLCTLFNDSVFAALDNAYPGKFKEWELACTPRNFWNIDTAREATIWLFREHLKYSDEQITQCVSRKFFVDHGFDTMMHVVFNNNASKAIENAFPGLLSKNIMR